MLHIASIQMPIFASHLHPSSISPPTRSNMCSQPPFWFHLIPIQVEIWISLPSTSRLTFTMAPIVTSHCLPGRVSPPPMSRHLHPTSIPGMNQLFPVHENCISALRSPYKYLQVSKCTSSFHPIPASPAPKSPILVTFLICVLYHLYPGHWIRISPPSMSRPTSNQVQTLVSHLIPGHMSPPSRSRKIHISSILVLFQPFHVSRYAA